MFYVYEWFIKETNEVIYVGKGCGRRYKVTKHNKFFNDMIKRFECDSRIIKEFATEKDAFDYEYERVKELKAVGQCVCNIYDGGSGGVVTWWTEERKQWYSEHNTMKSQTQRQRMSAQNPMKNEKVAEKVAQQNRKPVIINGKRYEGVTFAARELNVADQTIVSWCTRQERRKCCAHAGRCSGRRFCGPRAGQQRGSAFHNAASAGRCSTDPSQSSAESYCTCQS